MSSLGFFIASSSFLILNGFLLFQGLGASISASGEPTWSIKLDLPALEAQLNFEAEVEEEPPRKIKGPEFMEKRNKQSHEPRNHKTYCSLQNPKG